MQSIVSSLVAIFFLLFFSSEKNKNKLVFLPRKGFDFQRKTVGMHYSLIPKKKKLKLRNPLIARINPYKAQF